MSGWNVEWKHNSKTTSRNIFPVKKTASKTFSSSANTEAGAEITSLNKNDFQIENAGTKKNNKISVQIKKAFKSTAQIDNHFYQNIFIRKNFHNENDVGAKRKFSFLSIFSFALEIAALAVLYFLTDGSEGVILMLFLLIAGLIAAHIARRRTKKDPTLKGRGFYTAALLIGYITIAAALIYIIIVAIALSGGSLI